MSHSPPPAAGASDSGFRDVVQLQLKVLVACGRISLVHVQAQVRCSRFRFSLTLEGHFLRFAHRRA